MNDAPSPPSLSTSIIAKLNKLRGNPNIRPFNGEIIVTHRGKTIVHHAIRLTNAIPGTNQPGTMTYAIASLTKQITATLILQAVEEGRLHLDDPASLYLTSDFEGDITSPKYQATIHELLSHTSGFIDGCNNQVCAPGKTFNYASWSYAVLGHVLAHIYKKPFPELANQLFEKIGMKSAVAPERAKLRTIRAQNPTLIRGYHCQEDDVFLEANPEIGGNRGAAGAVIATTKDLALWNQALHNGQLLTANSYDLMTSAYSQSEHEVFGTTGYGYGLQVSKTKAGIEYSHLGHIPGYQSMSLYYPEADLSVILLINSDRLGQDDTCNAHEHLRHIRHLILDYVALLQ